jgi:glyoxylase-like metal-dependent hydrolase (beta-lactamase superfamily II)/8-oxo-dGTP pyrophosphatase MutT (NUDIX family)
MTAEGSADPTPIADARPAATVVLLRPADPGDPSGALEVLLTHRPSTMAFAPDMHVFPGGRVDAADGDPRLIARSLIGPDQAAGALGDDIDPNSAVAAFIAAIREVFEETGILLASRPGGGAVDQRTLAVARAELLHVPGAFLPMIEALDLQLRTDLLVPLSRWVTPPSLGRRFDARFFAAALPTDAEVSLLGDEVVAHAWHTPRAALDEMAAGRIGMWVPTSATLQQLEYASSIDQIRQRLAPGPVGAIVVEDVVAAGEGTCPITRITMPAGGGVSGQPINAYLVGSRRMVLVDPGDPTGPALDVVLALASERGGTINAIALTEAGPDHAAGAEAVRDRFDVPVLVGPGGGRDLPYATSEVADGDLVEVGAAALRVVWTPGPRPDHLAFVVEDPAAAVVAVLAGDLDGVRGARSIPGPADDVAWTASIARLRSAAPDAVWLSAHPPSSTDRDPPRLRR